MKKSSVEIKIGFVLQLLEWSKHRKKYFFKYNLKAHYSCIGKKSRT
jgi:hypothetical protein